MWMSTGNQYIFTTIVRSLAEYSHNQIGIKKSFDFIS